MPAEQRSEHDVPELAPSADERLVPLEFLRAALASLRCRERIAEGNHSEALLELQRLESALEVLASVAMPPDKAAEVKLLQMHHASHRAALRK